MSQEHLLLSLNGNAVYKWRLFNAQSHKTYSLALIFSCLFLHQNLRVRTVQGQQYQCQSVKRFHGGLEQKFILVDCQTVLYGTYR